MSEETELTDVSQPEVDQSSGIEHSSGIQHAASHELDVCGLSFECCCVTSPFYRRRYDLGRNGFGFKYGWSYLARQIFVLIIQEKVSNRSIDSNCFDQPQWE